MQHLKYLRKLVSSFFYHWFRKCGPSDYFYHIFNFCKAWSWLFWYAICQSDCFNLFLKGSVECVLPDQLAAHFSTAPLESPGIAFSPVPLTSLAWVTLDEVAPSAIAVAVLGTYKPGHSKEENATKSRPNWYDAIRCFVLLLPRSQIHFFISFSLTSRFFFALLTYYRTRKAFSCGKLTCFPLNAVLAAVT